MQIIRDDKVKEFGKLIKQIIKEKKTVEEYTLMEKCITWEKPKLLAQAKKKGVNVNQKELYTGDSLLHYAVREKKPGMVKTLVELGSFHADVVFNEKQLFNKDNSRKRCEQ